VPRSYAPNLQQTSDTDEELCGFQHRSRNFEQHPIRNDLYVLERTWPLAGSLSFPHETFTSRCTTRALNYYSPLRNAQTSKERNLHHIKDRAEGNRSGKLASDNREGQWRHGNPVNSER